MRDIELGIITGTMVGLGIMLGVLIHMQRSLVDAMNQLMVCERGGGVECHIERDGTEYNVYSWQQNTP